jgi:hypothetical protein
MDWWAWVLVGLAAVLTLVQDDVNSAGGGQSALVQLQEVESGPKRRMMTISLRGRRRLSPGRAFQRERALSQR